MPDHASGVERGPPSARRRSKRSGIDRCTLPDPVMAAAGKKENLWRRDVVVIALIAMAVAMSVSQIKAYAFD